MATKTSSFKFRKNDQIGAAGAEEDEFLNDCFLDTGDLDHLADLDDHRQIIVGRTGTGKSALLITLTKNKEDHVITISPEALALTYVSNSTVLKFFSDLGVNLDPFFKLLWRHVFTVEILIHHFSKLNEKKSKSIMDHLRDLFPGSSRKDKEHQSAIDYLGKWGEKFWKETEYRVKEITQRVENDLSTEFKAQFGMDFFGFTPKASAKETFSEEQKSELCKRGQEIVSKAQVTDLQRILQMLDTVLANPQKPYFIVIDGLDENWVEEKLRYKLIMALIQNLREFNKIRHVKLVIAMRRDLIERVFRLTRDSGFQEEKFHSLYLQLIWTKDQILSLLDSRINRLVRRNYTKQSLSHRDLLPGKFNNIPIGDYIFQMATRPRDVIDFFNICIVTAVAKNKVKTDHLRKAEGLYSRSRLNALGDEWSGDYPSLLDFTKVFRGRSRSFKIKNILDTEIEELCLEVAAENPDGRGYLQEISKKVAEGNIEPAVFKPHLIHTLYKVGLIGLKINPHETFSQVDELGKGISFGEITSETSVSVNAPFIRALGAVENKKRKKINRVTENFKLLTAIVPALLL